MNEDKKRDQVNRKMGTPQEQQRHTERPEDLESQAQQKGAQQVPTSQRNIKK